METEEQQILTFVSRARVDGALRKNLVIDAHRVVQEQGLSLAVAEVMLRLTPHLDVAEEPPISRSWWR